MIMTTLPVSLLVLSIYTTSILAQGANHANIHRGWHIGQGPYFCGTDADGDGPELLAAVLGPQCGATIWVKNTGTFGTSVNNGIGNCIQARLVDQEGGGAVDLNPAAWSALTNSQDGQVAVEWGYGSCPGAGNPPVQSLPAQDTPSVQPGGTSTAGISGACSVQANQQCGGRDFAGCTTCADGMQCTFFNEWWSDCKPGGYVVSRVRRGIASVRNV